MSKLQTLYKQAQQQLQSGDLASAMQSCKKCLKLSSTSPAVWALAGSIHAQRANYNDAETCFHKVVSLNPDAHEGWYYLAMSQVYLGRPFAQPLQHLNKALQLNKNYVAAWIGQGCLLRDANRQDEAIQCFATAIKLEPGNAIALINLGGIYKNAGEHDRALECFNSVLKSWPNHPEALAYKALVLYHQGHIKDAIDIITSVVATGIKHPLVAQAYAEISKNTEAIDDCIAYIEAVIGAPGLVQIQKEELHFAAARVLDAAGEYKKAFAHARGANQNRSNLFDVNDYCRHIDFLEKHYRVETIRELQINTDENITPVFIAGMPRSGSSLVEQILSCHPDIHAGGEMTILSELLQSFCGDSKDRFGASESIARLGKNDLASISSAYYEHINSISEGKNFVTDKLLVNFERIALIWILFPNAKIIHTRRHPLDICLSCYFQNFGNNHTYVYSLDKLASVYQQYDSLMAHWHTISHTPILDIRYEQLVSEPKQSIGRILEFCGLPWSDECLNFHKSKRLTKTASFDQVRKPLYKDSMERWRHYETELAELENRLKENIAAYEKSAY